MKCLPFTWNLLTATAPSDKPRTANGVIFRAKVIELKTATTVKAYRHKEMHRENQKRRGRWVVGCCLSVLSMEYIVVWKASIPALQWDRCQGPCVAWTYTHWQSQQRLEPRQRWDFELNWLFPVFPSPLIEPLKKKKKPRVRKSQNRDKPIFISSAQSVQRYSFIMAWHCFS